MPIYRATITLMPEVYLAENDTEAEELLEQYKEALGKVVSTIEFRDYHLSFDKESE
jgi:hypothetical protein